MMRDSHFVLIVQTGAIIQDLTSRLMNRSLDGLAAVDALDVVGWAIELNEFDVPKDVTTAAREFLDYCYAVGPRPDWLPDGKGPNR